MLNIIYNRFYFIFLSAIIVLSDQISKHLVSINRRSLVDRDLIIFTIDYIKNFGAAFNLFSGSRIFLSIVSLIPLIL